MARPPLFALRLAYRVGTGLMACALVAGFAYAFIASGRPPGLALSYATELDKLAQSSDQRVVLQSLRRTAELDLNAEAPLWKLLEAADRAGDRDQQVFALTGLVRANVGRADIPYKLACLYLEIPDVLLASHYATLAVQRDPDDPRNHCLLGATLLAQDRKLEAAREYRLALRIDPAQATAHRALQGPLQGF